MSANERSHVDQAVPTRPRRRRLVAHAAVFSIAGLLCLVLGSSASSAAPSTQPGRFLEAGTATVTYTCSGADVDTQTLLAAIGFPTFPMIVTVTTAAVEPSPSPGDDFDVDFIWDFALDPTLIATAVSLGTTQFDIFNSANPVSATDGATGSAPGTTAAHSIVPLGDGTTPVGYTQGPFTGTFNRTAAVDSPITFTPGTITSSVETPTGLILNITCAPGAGTITVNDQDGVAPTTTTTTRPEVTPTTAAPTTTAAVGAGGVLPVTGSSSSNLILFVLALGLLDIGYLALSASRPARRRVSTR